MDVEETLKTDKLIPLESRTIIHLLLINNKICEAMVHALKPFDVSEQQFNVLRILRGLNGKPANLSTLNERMITKMSNTTRLVDKLLLKGYLNRIVCPKNRRKIEIRITPEGSKALEQMDKAVNATQESLLHDFSKEELNTLNLLLNKF
ncbi:MarR family transcriptional regulator [Flavobacteriaceae bacterium F89]|uniref:MarR family transcriptional regulator n=1 Tax=Cerina litoralis TaxID=2874477 RepID=A0AAE3ERL3_9FLAO|nr:MarR family transcriptional regulator [Cerina litoralis]MCG2459638.1 MarR family transcriptional regulator [Cerina litoralis]